MDNKIQNMRQQNTNDVATELLKNCKNERKKLNSQNENELITDP